jgi:hypothetical protein
MTARASCLSVSESAVPLEILYHFFKAAAAAGAGGVLGDKDGVLAHGGLLAVVRRISGREPLIDEVSGVSLHRVRALALDVA